MWRTWLRCRGCRGLGLWRVGRAGRGWGLWIVGGREVGGVVGGRGFVVEWGRRNLGCGVGARFSSRP